MSSILTNNGAMVALQTLKSVNAGMAKTQDQISTGKNISTAKDNAAVWAISKTMEADVEGFKGISDALSIGESTVATAAGAAEKITTLLKDVKSKVVSAQTASTSDRAKIQTDINSLRDSIGGMVSAAQFNGVNLINGSSTDPMKVLSSLDRAGGSVTASHIDVDRVDLSMTPAVASTFGATAVTNTSIISNGGVAAGTAAPVANNATQDIKITSAGAGYSYRLTLNDTAGANKVGTKTFEYVATANDSANDVSDKLSQQMTDYFASNNMTSYSVVRLNDTVKLTNSSGAALSVTSASATGGTAASGGGLAALQTLDVSNDANAANALTSVESLLKTSINAAAKLGSAQNRLSTQNDFVGKLSDLMTSGIGSLVDADMEETSARLQALQVQQQLATQSLSIANQAPQQLLSLFR